MASLSPEDNDMNPIQRLMDLCVDKSFELRYHDCHRLSSLPPNYNACVTVNGVKVQGRGKTMQTAKEEAANQMLAYLEARSWNQEPVKEKKNAISKGDPKNREIWLQHPCSQLQDICQKRGLSFQFSDTKCLSNDPPSFSATATVMGITITAEGITLSDAKLSVATQLLTKLGWSKTKKTEKDNFNRPGSSLSTKNGESDSIVLSWEQRELQKICSAKNLSFKYHDCERADRLDKLGRPMFNASLTVNGDTIIRTGLTLQTAKNKAAMDMFNYLKSGKKGIDVSHPSKKLQYLCRLKGLSFQFSDATCLSLRPPVYTATATVLDVTVTAEGRTYYEAKFKVASEILRKLGWDKEEISETKANTFEELLKRMPEDWRRDMSHPCCRLYNLCERRGLRFKFSELQCLSSCPGHYLATATVLDETITAEGPTLEAAKVKVALELLEKLGWEEASANEVREIKSSDNFQENFQEHKELNILAEGDTCKDTNHKFTNEILTKWDLDEEIDETTKSIKNHKLENSFQSIPLKSEPGSYEPLKPLVKTELRQEKSVNLPTKSNSSTERITNSLFNNPRRSDITFIVGRPGEQKERIYGHSLIISLRSPVFDELFEENWKDKEEVEIEEHPEAFKSVMRFIYTQDIIMEQDYLLETLNLVKKYLVSGFMEEFISNNRLSEEILKNNIWSLLEFAFDQNEEELWYLAAAYFDNHCEDLIRQNSFLNLDVNVVTCLVRRSSLDINELSLFYATTLWAGNQCQEEGLEPTAENLRSKMNPFIHSIRFPLMTGPEFRDGPGITGILTGDECYKILCAITLGDKETCGFSYKLRDSCSKTDKIKTQHSEF